MSRWRCKSCKGEYEDPGPDGTRYFHTCPPLVDPETGESKARPKARDERPQDVSIVRTEKGYSVLGVGGKVLATNAAAPAAPMIAEGAGREKIR